MDRINPEIFRSSVHRFQYYQRVAAHVYMKDACRQVANYAIYPVYMCMMSGFLQVFHKLITTGNHRLQSLFDCLLTIIVNGLFSIALLTEY